MRTSKHAVYVRTCARCEHAITVDRSTVGVLEQCTICNGADLQIVKHPVRNRS